MAKISIEENYIKMAVEHLNRVQVSGIENMQNVIIAVGLLQKGEAMEGKPAEKEVQKDGR